MSTMLPDEAISSARGALRARRPQDAVNILLSQADLTHLPGRDYDELLRMFADALTQVGSLRAAATVWLYLRDATRMAQVSTDNPKDLGRAAMLAGDTAAAAQYYRTARWPAHAAIAYERSRQFATARTLWEEVMADPRLREDPYTAALVNFNLGRVLAELADAQGAHRCRVRATRLLEEAADVLEARALRDRAFDCFQMLFTLGAETGSFENVAEGYLNCIRILKEDHLSSYAMQYYEDFVRRAERAGEHHAVATILHEASDYARSLGKPFHGTLRVREAESWRKAADSILALGGAVELAENALLAAVGAYSAVRMHGRAVGVFSTLATLPGLDEKRAVRYRGLAARYSAARDEVSHPAPLPDMLQEPVADPDIWNVDVIEWEEQGDPIEACGEILLAPKMNDYVRRKALLARLVPLTVSEPEHPKTLAHLAERLGTVSWYSVLSPLEYLYGHGRGETRVAVLRAARQLFFKRTYTLVMKGVVDEDPAVRRAAIDAIGYLHFPYAFDPLSRLHRDSADPAVRHAALTSIGRIRSLEAVEYLLGVLTQGAPEEHQHVTDLLIRNDAPETTHALQVAAADDGPDVAREIQKIIRARAR